MDIWCCLWLLGSQWHCIVSARWLPSIGHWPLCRGAKRYTTSAATLDIAMLPPADFSLPRGWQSAHCPSQHSKLRSLGALMLHSALLTADAAALSVLYTPPPSALRASCVGRSSYHCMPIYERGRPSPCRSRTAPYHGSSALFSRHSQPPPDTRLIFVLRLTPHTALKCTTCEEMNGGHATGLARRRRGHSLEGDEVVCREIVSMQKERERGRVDLEGMEMGQERWDDRTAVCRIRLPGGG